MNQSAQPERQRMAIFFRADPSTVSALDSLARAYDLSRSAILRRIINRTYMTEISPLQGLDRDGELENVH